MMGKKTLSEIRASIRGACGPSGADLIKSLDARVRKLERRQPPKPVEIETLKLIRDGLRAEPKSVSKVSRTKGKRIVKTVDAGQLRGNFADALDTVASGKRRIAVLRDGKQVAALVSADDLAILEALEDRIDVVLAKKALREKGSVPWSQVKKRLGLK